MPVPSPRNSIRIARGNYADLAANATEIGEGELCFALDQDKFYSKAGSSLVAVGGGTELYSIAQLGDVDVAGATNGQVLVYNTTEGKWVPADQSGGGTVDSVNGQTGVVVLDASDVGAATAAQGVTADSAVQPGDLATVATSGSYNDLTDKPAIPANTSDLTNDSGFITSADVPPAFDGGEVSLAITTPEETITATWNLSQSNFWYCSGGATVPNPVNAVSGMSGLIRLTAAPTGWGSNIKHPGGSAETISSFPAVVPFYVQSSSVILLGKATQGIA